MNNTKQQFTWIPFYREFAQKLLAYRKDRTTLLSYIYSKREELQISYLHDQEGSNDLCPDIDPFTVMGIFNRGIKNENRINIAKQLATFLKVQSDIPTDFNGIPLLNNQMSHFFGFRDKRGIYDIENLWQLFEDVVLNKNVEEDYNKVIKQYIININITMALFWINPNEYMAFDSKNRTYLRNEYGIELPYNAPEYKEYMNILNNIKTKMSLGEITEQTFYEISANAFTANYATATDKQPYSVETKENNPQMANQQYCHYINLLKANHNIIFNGAPGTGKTYLAKEIAEEMGAKYKMVQFHPSYDYTDFVEGLRPIKDAKGNIGFERKDGVFKRFCKEALHTPSTKRIYKNYNNIQNEPTPIANSTNTSFNTLYEQLKERIKRQTVTLYSDFRNSRNSMKVVVEYGDIKFEKSGNYQRAIPDYVKKIFEYYRNRNIWDISNTRFDDYTRIIGNTIDYSYYRGIVQELLNMSKAYPITNKETPHTNEIIEKQEEDEETSTPFVFIIDEINRGEISKIFGELFYSIDPGYRGVKGKVQTQYQNLVEDGDVFKDGFYVPENVYIIGTMNDIDRSVESMDFAMRRRFAWQEITAEESAESMGITGELRERMDSLNKVILETEGLGSSYQVGAAIFLKVKKGEMTEEELWNLNLKSLIKEYLRGMPEADDTLLKMEDAYFLKDQDTNIDEQEKEF